MPAGCLRSISNAMTLSPEWCCRLPDAVSIAAPECQAKRSAMVTEERVAQHYGSAGIAERILAALRAAQGSDAPVTPDALAPLDHFHGGGVIATQALAAMLKPQPGARLPA